jgi:general stress protein 26
MMTSQQCQDIWEIIKDIKTAMVVSSDDNSLRARPMNHLQKEFDGTLYFFTKKSAAKVEEVQQDNHVCISYADTQEKNYVSLSGTVTFSEDRALIEGLWSPPASAFFPEGKDDPDLVVMSVHINRAEIWDAEKSAMVLFYETVKSNLTGGPPDLGENRKYG